MSSLSEWRSSYTDDHKFLVHQLPPCSLSHLLDEIRIDSFDASYSVCYAFMTIWCLGGWVPRVRLGFAWCANLSWFSHLSFGHCFAFSLLFHSFYISPYSILCSRVFFLSKIPFFVLHFLVSPSCFFFFSDSSMVDYFAVRVDCSSIAFFFAHLGSWLESIEGEHLERISSFLFYWGS